MEISIKHVMPSCDANVFLYFIFQRNIFIEMLARRVLKFVNTSIVIKQAVAEMVV